MMSYISSPSLLCFCSTVGGDGQNEYSTTMISLIKYQRLKDLTWLYKNLLQELVRKEVFGLRGSYANICLTSGDRRGEFYWARSQIQEAGRDESNKCCLYDFERMQINIVSIPEENY